MNIIILSLIVLYLLSAVVWLKVIEKNDPKKYLELGEPKIPSFLFPGHAIAILVYLLSFKYLGNKSNSVKLWGIITVVLFISCLLGLVVGV
jgi:hypothetical protein